MVGCGLSSYSKVVVDLVELSRRIGADLLVNVESTGTERGIYNSAGPISVGCRGYWELLRNRMKASPAAIERHRNSSAMNALSPKESALWLAVLPLDAGVNQ